MLGAKLEIRFGSLPAFEDKFFDHNQQVDLAVLSGGSIQSWQNGIVILLAHSTADLKTNIGTGDFRWDFKHCSVSQGGDHDGFDCVHAVFGLIEDDRSLGFEDIFSDFHTVEAVLLIHLLADTGVTVVEGRQAVQEFDTRIAGQFHRFSVDLVRLEQIDTLLPN